MTASSADEQLKGAIVGLCNPLLDINAAVELPFLDKYDLKANDGILADDKHLPLYEELERDYPITYTVGGAGQNTLRGAQRFLPSGSTVFMGSVGADEHAVKLQAKAAEDGLRTEYYVDTEKPTGVSACLITDNNRSLVTNLSAANSFKIDHIQKPEIKALIENAKCFYITGFFITVSPDTILSIAKHAHETGKPFMMNISAPFVPMFYKDTFEQIMPYIDGLFGNESEAEAFAKTFGWDKEGVDPTSTGDVATRLASMFKLNPNRPRMVVITNSSNPAVVAFGPSAHSTDVALTGATGPFPRQEWYPVPVVPRNEIVDTNSAGDAFCAGFLSQLVLGHDTKRCVRAGHFSAGLILRQLGSNYPDGDLAAMLEEYLAAKYSN